jgi:hypothetical protein
MLAGRRFKLREPVIATTIENDGERVAVIVPTSSIVEIITGTASGLRVLDVLWDGKVFAMFESDIAERGDELGDQTAAPRPARVENHLRKQAEKARRAAGF